MGVGPRHLHRLFVQHLGASPITVAQTRRLLFTKHLLDETELPMTEIALAAGFRSVRRFNHVFQRTYRRAPRDLRKRRRGGLVAARADEFVLKLAFRPPYDWPQVRDFLAKRALAGVERVDERGYARTVASGGGYAIVCVRALGGEDALELRGVWRAGGGAAPALVRRAAQLRSGRGPCAHRARVRIGPAARAARGTTSGAAHPRRLGPVRVRGAR